MSHTLQRKMFKASGSAAHGGGITANLKDPNRVHMNKGGFIPQRVGYQPKDHPARQGNREGHAGPLAAILPFLGLGTRFLPAVGRALSGKGIGGLKNILKFGDEGGAATGKFFDKATGTYKYKGFTETSKKVARRTKKGKLMKDKDGKTMYKTVKTKKDISKSGMNRDQYKNYLKKVDPEKYKQQFGDYGFGTMGKGRQIARGLEMGALPAAGVGLGSSLLPAFDQTENTNPILNVLDTTFREIPQGALNAVTGLPLGALGLLAGQGGAGFTPSQAIQNTLYPDGPKDIKQVAEGEELTQAKVKGAAEASLREEYENLLGGRPSATNETAKAIAASLSALEEGDLAGASAAYTQQLGTGVDKMNEYDRGVGQYILQDKVTEKQTNSAMIAEALASGDLDTVSKIKKYQAAAEELGDVTPLPTKGKNQPDYDSMRAGTVYADVTTSTGSKYLAVNRSGDDELRTNSADAAVNFANA